MENAKRRWWLSPPLPKIRHNEFLFSIQVFKSAAKLLSPGWKISLLMSPVRFLNLSSVNGKKSYPESEPCEVFLRIIVKSCYACTCGGCVYVYTWLHAFSFFVIWLICSYLNVCFKMEFTWIYLLTCLWCLDKVLLSISIEHVN